MRDYFYAGCGVNLSHQSGVAISTNIRAVGMVVVHYQRRIRQVAGCDNDGMALSALLRWCYSYGTGVSDGINGPVDFAIRFHGVCTVEELVVSRRQPSMDLKKRLKYVKKQHLTRPPRQRVW